MAYFNGSEDFLLALKGEKGEKGDNGESSKWFCGTGITGSSTESTVFPFSNVSNAKMYDMYLNTDTGSVYQCVIGGAADEAKWRYKCNIKGDSVELAATLDEQGKAAEASMVGEALKETATKKDLAEYVSEMRDEVIKAVMSAEDMDKILSEDPERVLGKHFMYVGETTNKYRKGGVYKLTEEIMD